MPGLIRRIDDTESSGGRSPFLLGFYEQLQVPVTPLMLGIPRLIPICNEGRALKYGRWGSLVESLSFLPQPELALIMKSSNGWLLCCTDRTKNMDYIVCNPVTREFRIVPDPHELHRYVALAFSCKGDHTLMGMQYEIYRVSVASPTSSATTFEMETFSSASGEWTKSSFVLPTAISLGVAFGPTLMLEGVIYWRGYDRLGVVPDNVSRIVMVAYDPSRESSVEVIRLPAREGTIKTWTNVIGHSEGKICHARTDSKEIEVWVLEVIQRGEWIMKHRVSVDEMLRDNSRALTVDCVGILQFHPRMKMIFITLNRKAYWYNYQSGRLSRVAGARNIHISFPYEWPCQPSYDS